MPREINSVAVLGGGLMGAGIAEVSAVAGIPVVVRDLPQFLDAARGRVEKSLADAVKRGKMDQAKRDEVLARITFTPDLKDVASADMVIEAVPEILDLKVALIKELDELVSPGNVIATNTSSIRLSSLRARCSIRDGWSESISSRQFKREEYAPPPLLKRMIAAGWLGRKSGRGFYEYDK
jgi:3-hydroxybutyryl-CoA dehydrogenase